MTLLELEEMKKKYSLNMEIQVDPAPLHNAGHACPCIPGLSCDDDIK